MKIKIPFIFLTLIIFSTNYSGAAKLEVTESQVGFIALATPGALKISGKEGDAKGLKTEIYFEQGKLGGTSTLKLDTLTTGIGLRDKHMKENYLEVSKFPETQFTYKKLNLPSQLTGEKIPFEGVLKLHGIEKPVSGMVKAAKEGSKLSLEHEFKIKTGDFGISTPKYMGVTMGEEVVVQVKIEGTLP
ncbi:MAG: YceI family protein [Deltaproteobacteria bacterium]